MWSRDRIFLALGAIALCTLTGCGRKVANAVPLESVAVYPIEAPFSVEPSGLCLRDGRLFSISDDTDDTIFEIVLEDAVARFVPFLRFTPPASRWRMDFEGIAAGPDGSFYLASENLCRVLQVFSDGTSSWASPSALREGRAAGLFRNPSAQVEGLAVLPGSTFLLAAEREPRGLVVIRPDGQIEAQTMNETRFPHELALMRNADLTGLDYFDGVIWALFRNANLITTLERGEEGWREGAVAWSFRHVVEDSEFAYRDMRFGHAEGLAVDADHFYVVLDNNRGPRAHDSRDTRPLLLILRRPDRN